MKTQIRGSQVLDGDILSNDIGVLTGSLVFSSGSIYMGSGGAGPFIISGSHGIELTGSLALSGSAIFDTSLFEITGDTLELSGSLIVTGSTVVRGELTVASGGFVVSGQDAVISPTDVGGDVFFWISGSASSNPDQTTSAFDASPRKAVFGGDVVISGSAKIANDLFFNSGSIQVQPGPSGHRIVIKGNPATAAATAASLKFFGGNDDVNTTAAVSAGNIIFQSGDASQGATPGEMQFQIGVGDGTVNDARAVFYVGDNGGHILINGYVGDEGDPAGPSVGVDTILHVSGTIDREGYEGRKTVVGGDVVVSGSAYLANKVLYASGSVVGVGYSAKSSESSWLYPFDVIPSTVGVVADAVVIAGNQTMAGVLVGEGDITGFPPITTGANISLSSGDNSNQFTSGSTYGFLVSANDGEGNTLSRPLVQATYVDPGRPAIVFGGRAADIMPGNSPIGRDTFFFASGSLDGSDKSVFGGDVVVSGSLTATRGTTLTSVAYAGAGPHTAPLVGFVLVSPDTINPTILYLPSSVPDGIQMTVKRRDTATNARALWVSGSGADKIDDLNGATISTNYGSMTFVRHGGAWYIT